MNIFYIDPNPTEAAMMLADRHILKMQIESAQMLSTAHWETGSTAPYKKTHKNHPSSKWVRESIQHYDWLVQHGLAICDEFFFRYGKEHKTKKILEWLRDFKPNIPDKGFTEPPCCMPDQYKLNDAVSSYRNFYVKEKVETKGLEWKKVPSRKPSWV